MTVFSPIAPDGTGAILDPVRRRAASAGHVLNTYPGAGALNCLVVPALETHEVLRTRTQVLFHPQIATASLTSLEYHISGYSLLSAFRLNDSTAQETRLGPNVPVILSRTAQRLTFGPGLPNGPAARPSTSRYATVFCQPRLQGILVNADLTAETNER